MKSASLSAQLNTLSTLKPNLSRPGKVTSRNMPSFLSPNHIKSHADMWQVPPGAEAPKTSMPTKASACKSGDGKVIDCRASPSSPFQILTMTIRVRHFLALAEVPANSPQPEVQAAWLGGLQKAPETKRDLSFCRSANKGETPPYRRSAWPTRRSSDSSITATNSLGFRPVWFRCG